VILHAINNNKNSERVEHDREQIMMTNKNLSETISKVEQRN